MEEIPSLLTPQARSRSLLQFSCAYVWANPPYGVLLSAKMSGGRELLLGMHTCFFRARKGGASGIFREELRPPRKSCFSDSGSYLGLPACSKSPPFRYELLFGAIARVFFAYGLFVAQKRNLPEYVGDNSRPAGDHSRPRREQILPLAFFCPPNVCTRQRQKYCVFDQRFKCLTPGSSRYVATNVKPGHNVEENGTLCSPQSVALSSWGLDNVQ